MAKISEWSGDKHSKKMLPNDTNRKLNDFCNAHKSIYIYGAGKIGTGFKNYLEQCDVPLRGFVVSDTLEQFKKIYKQGEIGVIIGLSDKNLGEVMPLISAFVSQEDLFIADSEYRREIGHFNVEYVCDNFNLGIRLVSHCNLNCIGCSSFSSLDRPDYYEYVEMAKDLEQLKKIGLSVKSISLTGGEPYLHPDLFKIFCMTRELFPDAEIKCITNGTFLNQLSEKQVNKLVELNIINNITVYPNYHDTVESFCSKADDIGAKYNIIYYDEPKLFTLFKLDLSDSAPKHTFYNCFIFTIKKADLNFYKGKMYGCCRVASICYFNDYFNTDFKIRNGDFIDIYNTTPEEIYKFSITRMPFCGYCNTIERELVEWGISERKIEEWVHFD